MADGATVSLVDVLKAVQDLANSTTLQLSSLRDSTTLQLSSLRDSTTLQISSLRDEFNQRFERNERSLSDLRENLNQRFERNERSLSDLRETLYRNTVSKMFGESCSKGFTIRSLDNIVHLIRKSGTWGDEDISNERLQRTNALARALLRQNAAVKYLRRLRQVTAARLAELGVENLEWVDEAGGIVRSNIGSTIGVLGSTNRDDWLKRKLEKLKLLADAEAEEEQITVLRTCRGPGVMLAMFLANEQDYLNDNSSMAEEAIDLDVRGSITIIRHHCSIWVGEIKSDASAYSKAVVQLRRRTLLFQWAVIILCPEITEVVRIGRLFTSAKSAGNLPPNNITDDLSLFVHGL